MGLGSYPRVSIIDARKKANEYREKLKQGVDPLEAKKADKQREKAATRGAFKAIAEEWYTHKAKGWASETARKAREILDDSLLPKIGKIPVASLSSSDVKQVLLQIHEHAPTLATKARQFCSQIISYAIQEGLREDGRELSLRGILPKSDKNHYPAVTKTSDLPALLKAINGISSIYSRVALLTCLYTASRPGVVVGMRWEELNLANKEWHVPANRMKTGNDHITPLPVQLIPLLEQLKALVGETPFVFPSATDPLKKHLHRESLSKVLRENGLRGVTVTHGFRATFRTVARERLKIAEDILEAQLAHAKKGQVQAAYDRTQHLEERHVMVQNWADYLDSLASGAKVIPLFHAANR